MAPGVPGMERSSGARGLGLTSIGPSTGGAADYRRMQAGMMMGGRKGGGFSSDRPGMPGMTGFERSNVAPEGSKKKPNLTRTEFVILFCWREYTPSDELFKVEEAPAASAEGAGGMMPSMPGAPPAAAGGPSAGGAPGGGAK